MKNLRKSEKYSYHNDMSRGAFVVFPDAPGEEAGGLVLLLKEFQLLLEAEKAKRNVQYEGKTLAHTA